MGWNNKVWSILHPCNWEDIIEEEDKFYIRVMNEMALERMVNVFIQGMKFLEQQASRSVCVCPVVVVVVVVLCAKRLWQKREERCVVSEQARLRFCIISLSLSLICFLQCSSIQPWKKNHGTPNPTNPPKTKPKNPKKTTQKKTTL